MSSHSVNGCVPAHRGAHAERLEHGRQPAAQLAQLGDRARRRRRAARWRARAPSRASRRRCAPRMSSGSAASTSSERESRPHVARLEQHHLLLDADRPRRARARRRSSRTSGGAAHAARTSGSQLAVALGLVDQRAEERELLGELDQRLGVPLHAHEHAVAVVLDGLDDAVGRPRHGPQARGRAGPTAWWWKELTARLGDAHRPRAAASRPRSARGASARARAPSGGAGSSRP